MATWKIVVLAATALVVLVATRLLGNALRAILRLRRPRWVRLDIEGPLPARAVPRRAFLARRGPLSLAEIGRLVRELGADPRVRGVLVRLRAAPGGWARLEELREHLAALGAAGKHVAVHLSGPGTRELLAATAVPLVFVDESAPIAMHGLGAEVTFFGGALEKLGVRAELVYRGKYKSFAETYTRKDMSEAHREAAEAMVGGLAALARRWIAAGRNVDEARADALLTGGPYMPAAAAAAGLVDEVCYLDEVTERWKKRLPEADARTMPGDIPGVAAWRRSRSRPLRFLPFGIGARRHRGRVVRLLQLHGAIVDGEGSAWPRQLLGAEPACRAIDGARRDKRVAAVVLHVDSRGGSASASDLMWRQVVRLAAEKPVIAYFDDTAASGGYYLACAATGIVARPGTLTGSIGVVAGKIQAAELMAKLGLHVELVRHGEAAAMHSPARPFSPEERRRLEAELDALYQQFVHKVAAGRKRTPDAVEPVAQGRVWLGVEAAERGLVDRVGGVEDAIRWARELAKLPAPPPGRPDADVEDARPPAKAQPLIARLLGGAETSLAAPPSALDTALVLWRTRGRFLYVPEVEVDVDVDVAG
jgi:protease-4